MPQIRSFGQYPNSGIPPYDAYARHGVADSFRRLHWGEREFTVDIGTGSGVLGLGLEVIIKEGSARLARLQGSHASVRGEWNDGSALAYECVGVDQNAVVGRIQTGHEEGHWWPMKSLGTKAALGRSIGQARIIADKPWQDSLLEKQIQCVMRIQEAKTDDRYLLALLLAPVVMTAFWSPFATCDPGY